MSDFEMVGDAIRGSGRNLAWATASGLVIVWLFPGGWHVASVASFLEGLAAGERDRELYQRFRKVDGDPLNEFRRAR